MVGKSAQAVTSATEQGSEEAAASIQEVAARAVEVLQDGRKRSGRGHKKGGSVIRKAEADLQPVQIAHKVYAMIFRYKADLTTHNAWLRHPRRKRAPQEVQLVVKAYGRAVVVVERWEAEHDFEIISATHQELEQLREAGYNVALAAHFREIEA